MTEYSKATLWTSSVGAVALAAPHVFTRVAEFAQATVLSKMQSSSGVERNSWNQQAWSNFRDSYGLGVGLGSARASGFALVLLSNVGLAGTLTGWPLASATAHSAAVFDLGIAFYVFAAAASVRVRPLAATAADVAWTSASSARWARAAASQP